MNQLTLTALSEFPMIEKGDHLSGIILQSLEKLQIKLQNGDILVLAQKIVSKAEDRWVDLRTITPGPRALELARQTEKDARLVEMILQESAQNGQA